MGKLAQEKATNPRVKAFGVMMVRDHTKANEELKKIAASKKIPVPSSKESYNAHIFNPKGGKGFEMDYINMMIKDHNETMSLFQRASSNIKDPDLKVFVDKTLHVIHRHLDSARAIYGALMPSDQMDSPVKEKFDDKVTD
jgi:putative membrane protein